jgi:hypothetical protein
VGDWAAGMTTALDLLRKLQWSGDGYTCISCKAMHRDGCRPGCEVTALLEPALRPRRRRAKTAPAASDTMTTLARKSTARPLK